jgi:uncharacterized protein (TIGR02001 family)
VLVRAGAPQPAHAPAIRPSLGRRRPSGGGTEAAKSIPNQSSLLCASSQFEKEIDMSKQTLAALAVAIAATGAVMVPTASQAQVVYNVGAVTDYRYRGISQSRLKPALQGGLDYAAGPFYLGAWASTIRWVKDDGSNSLELDLYGGYKGEFSKGFGYDVGLLAYIYPGHDLATSPQTTELYGALTFGPATLKYSHSLSNLFGFDDSKNSGYIDLSASFEITDGWMIAPHIGRQTVKNAGAFSYTDASLTLSKDFKGVVVSLAAVDARTGVYRDLRNKDLGKRSLVLGAKYNF